MNTIRFYKVGNEFGNFSNFASFPIFIDGEVWPTVEHYFQANKFEDLAIRNKIKIIDSPMKAAKEGRNTKNILRADWLEIKDNIMFQGLLSKFLQHHNLKEELLNTGNAQLVEHTKNDSYWGDGGDGNGLNKLGFLLMRVRKIIREINNDSKIVMPPWVAFPKVDQHDMFWHMGLGENYLYTWSHYYQAIENKEQYQQLFPVTIGWEGFYD